MAEKMVDRVLEISANQKNIRNIAICAHIDHGKTTFSDNLLAGAGMMSAELAGKQLALDFHEDEQARGITIDAANVSMVHTVNGDDFLINLIDTPGHVDFGGDVTRAMRAVDGAIVLVDAVEGVMPQTETVLRQALKERVQPVLFINKVDRLIKELQLTPEAMQERFVKVIGHVNKLIKDIAEKILPAEISPACGSTTIFVIQKNNGPFGLQDSNDFPSSDSRSPRQSFGILYFCASTGLGWCLTTISKTTSCNGAFFASSSFLSSL